MRNFIFVATVLGGFTPLAWAGNVRVVSIKTTWLGSASGSVRLSYNGKEYTDSVPGTAWIKGAAGDVDMTYASADLAKEAVSAEYCKPEHAPLGPITINYVTHKELHLNLPVVSDKPVKAPFVSRVEYTYLVDGNTYIQTLECQTAH